MPHDTATAGLFDLQPAIACIGRLPHSELDIQVVDTLAA